MLTLPFTATDSAKIPTRAYKGDAGYDLCSTADLMLQPFKRALIPTGISIELPSGYAGFVLPRSGLAIKQGLSLVNTPGLIDSNYRGELKAIAINLDPQKPITIKAGDRIAQLVIMKVADAAFTQVEHLEESARNSGGFGSSGVESN
ncbi:MAG: dUTP diphosphatase [Coriobacteriia bacterium]|nr:dUTP diphosphatase [Coriobacteriia bacterium]